MHGAWTAAELVVEAAGAHGEGGGRRWFNIRQRGPGSLPARPDLILREKEHRRPTEVT